MATKAEIVEFLDTEYPHTNCTVEAVGGKSATVKLQVGTNELRPGGTVSGPVLMTVADVALYVAILQDRYHPPYCQNKPEHQLHAETACGQSHRRCLQSYVNGEIVGSRRGVFVIGRDRRACGPCRRHVLNSTVGFTPVRCSFLK